VANELKDYANPSVLSERQNVEVESVLNLALRDLQEDIVRSGASILHGSLPAIHSHPGELLRIFQNLIIAAIRHGGERPQVMVDAERQDGRWVFCLGGIFGPSAAGVKLLDEAESSAARMDFKELSICRRIVERHGGRLWIATGAHEGPRICFTLSA
jgi:light-regulated signal transduction histidine kinase (bacteriophytochrome)